MTYVTKRSKFTRKLLYQTILGDLLSSNSLNFFLNWCMETSCRRVSGKVVQNVGSDKINRGFTGVCSYLLDVIGMCVS